MPYFDNTEERKAGPTRHTKEQLALIICPHDVEVPRRWWREQEAIVQEAARHPMIPALQERIRRLPVHCLDCGSVIIARYSERPTFARRIRLVGHEDALTGELVDEPVGEVIDERDVVPEPTGVVDEVELPSRSRRK